MRTHKRTALLGSILASLLLTILPMIPTTATAATAGGNGIQVSPVTTNLTISPGETRVVTIYVKNVVNTISTLQVSINDFTTAAGNESGTPALLLNPGEYAPVHSLKRYVTPIGNITLQPNEQKAVNVEIVIPKGTSGGGYYGAVRFSPAKLDATENVNLAASVASLILVRVPGNFKEQLNLASLDVRQGENSAPRILFTSNNNLIVAVRLQNVGDVQEQPFGKVLLRQDKNQLGSYEINTSTPRGNVLPDSTRMFTVHLDKVGFFGKYTVLGNFGYGTNGQVVSGQTTFYVVPLPAILGILVFVAIVAFFIFVFPRLKKQYDRSVMARARRR